MSKAIYLLKRNSFFALSSTCIRLFSNAVLFVLIARFYGPESFGQFTTAHTLSTIFVLVADFGFDLFLTTQIAGDRNQASFLLPRMLALKLVFSLIASLLMCAVPFIGNLSSQANKLVYIFSLYVFFSAILNFFFALFKGHEEFQHETLISFILNLFLLAALAVLGLLAASLYWIAGVFIGSRILGLGLAIFRSKKYLSRITPIWDPIWIWNVKNQVIFFGLFIIFGNLFFTLDTILLSFWKGDYQVGIYQAVFRIIAITLVIPDIMINTLLPTLSRLFAVDKQKWRHLGLLASKTLFFLGLLLGFIIIYSAKEIIDIVYGNAMYYDAVPILRVFGAIIIIRYSVEVPALMLTTSNRQSVRMLFVIMATVMNYGMNSYAIPNFGAVGAAYASLATNFFVGIGYVIAIQNRAPENWFTKERLLPFLILLMGGSTMMYIPIPIWSGVFAVAAVYLVIVFYLGYSVKEKELLFKNIISFKLS